MKIWVLRILTVVLPSAVLVLGTEAVLRVASVGESLSFAHRRAVDGVPHWEHNPHFGRLFFPPQLSRACLPFQIPVAPSPPHLRVFLLGGSAAMGIPEPAYSMGRMLEEMLRHEFPGVEVEVINTAITAVNSHVVWQVAQACAEMSPDLFVIYLGNNEVVGPYGAGTIFAPLSGRVGWIRAGLAFRTTRLGQALHRLLRDDSALPSSWRGMEMFQANQVGADDPRLDAVVANFRRNLTDILSLAAARGIATAVGTVAVNLRDCAPFGSRHRPGLTEAERVAWQRHWSDATAAADRGAWNEALAAAERCAAIDDGFAELHFQHGRWLQASGDLSSAAAAYARARDLDTLRFRHDTRLAAALRQVVTEFDRPGISLVETAAAVAAASPDGLPGREMFLEHVHLTPAGTYEVARAFFTTVRTQVPPAVAARAREAGPLTYREVLDRLPLTTWDHHRLLAEVHSMLGGPPFTAQSTQPAERAAVSARVDSLAAALNPDALAASRRQYQTAIQAHPNAWLIRYRLAGFLLGTGLDPAGAARVFREVTRRFPRFPAAHNDLALALAATNDLGGAAQALRTSLALDPFQPAAHNNLANCLLSQGDVHARMEAITHYERAYRLDPSDNFRTNWNVARHRQVRWLVEQRRTKEAITLLRGILTSAPDDPEAHFNLASLLAGRGEREEAIGHLREVLRVHPGDPQAQQLLRRLEGR